MIITKEGEEFQKLLKKVEYLENVMRCSKYYAGCDLIEERKTPEFKVGDWVVRTVGKPAIGRELGRIFRIYKVYGSDIRADDSTTHFSSSLRKATNEEIRDHLIKVAQEKSLVGWRRFKWENENEVTTINPGQGYEYVRSVDALTVGVGEDCSRRAIYMDGKWATPFYGRAMPQTSVQLIELLKDFCDYNNLYGSDFSDTRDDDIRRFINKNGF